MELDVSNCIFYAVLSSVEASESVTTIYLVIY